MKWFQYLAEIADTSAYKSSPHQAFTLIRREYWLAAREAKYWREQGYV